MIVEADQVENLQGWLAGWRPREELQFKSRSSLLAKFLLFQGMSVFFLRPPTQDEVPSHYGEQSTLLKVY